jgi:5-(carboxyamino)imidazole ribonucleotide synthase
LVANEMAPRVHNSGHWTIEGAVTSQFENHLRAVAGLPLGNTGVRDEWTMFNLVGGEPSPATFLTVPGAHLHLYGKASKPGRKIGHVTVLRRDATAVESLVRNELAG